MGEILDTAKFAWDVVKDGVKVDGGKTVNVLPAGTTMMDFQDWQGPVSFDETFEEVSFLFGSPVADFVLTTAWEFNGAYIGNFHLRAEGTVQLLSSIDVSITTLEAHMNEDDVAELPYEITVVFRNLTSGTRRKIIRAVATGQGGGRSLE